MKQTILFSIAVAFMLISTRVMAQETSTKVQEFGLGMSSLNSFSIQYRWGNEQKLYRISGSISASHSDGTNNTYLQSSSNNYTTNLTTKSPLNSSLGLNFSILKTKPLADKLGIIYGEIIGSSYSYTDNRQTGDEVSISSSNDSQTISQKGITQLIQPYVGFVIGLNYKISSSFGLYAEVTPNIYFQYYKTSTKYSASSTPIKNNQDITNKEFGISGLTNSGAMLTFAYRISQ